MSGRRTGYLFVLGIVAALVLMGLRSCGLLGPSYSWRQKLTVNVETPQGLRSASSVFQIKIMSDFGPHGSFFRSIAKGEAVVLKLPADDRATSRWLFAVGSRRSGNMVLHAYSNELAAMGVKLRGGGRWDTKERYRRTDDLVAYPPAELTYPPPRTRPDYYPVLLTFTDINDPKTIMRVDPNDFAAAFGPGYSLKSITLKITNEPVTEGLVAEVLGWYRGVWPKLSKRE